MAAIGDITVKLSLEQDSMTRALLKSMEAIRACEDFVLSVLPLVSAANGVGGVDAAVAILKKAQA